MGADMAEDEELAVWTNIVAEVCGVFFGYTLGAAGVKFAFGVFQGISYTDFVFVGVLLAALDAGIRVYQFRYQGKPFERYRSETDIIPAGMTLETFTIHVRRSAYAGAQIFLIMVPLYVFISYVGEYGYTVPTASSVTSTLVTTPYGTIAAIAIFLAFTQFYLRFQEFPIGFGTETDES